MLGFALPDQVVASHFIAKCDASAGTYSELLQPADDRGSLWADRNVGNVRPRGLASDRPAHVFHHTR